MPKNAANSTTVLHIISLHLTQKNMPTFPPALDIQANTSHTSRCGRVARWIQDQLSKICPPPPLLAQTPTAPFPGRKNNELTHLQKKCRFVHFVATFLAIPNPCFLGYILYMLVVQTWCFSEGISIFGNFSLIEKSGTGVHPSSYAFFVRFVTRITGTVAKIFVGRFQLFLQFRSTFHPWKVKVSVAYLIGSSWKTPMTDPWDDCIFTDMNGSNVYKLW